MPSVKYHVSDDATITRVATATATPTPTATLTSTATPVTIPVSLSTSIAPRRWSAATIIPIQAKTEDVEHQLKVKLKHQHVATHMREGSGTGTRTGTVTGSGSPLIVTSPASASASASSAATISSPSTAIHIQSTTMVARTEKAETSITSHSKSHSNSNSNSDSNVVDAKQKLRKHAQWYHIWALGVLGAMSGCFVSWTSTLVYGFGPAVLTQVVIGIGYATMIYSYSELTACIPFSGGSFGFVRATMGIVPALLVGVAESLEYMLAVCVSVMQLSQMCTMLTGLNVKYEILWYFLIYTFALSLHIRGGRVLWNSILTTAIMGLSCIVIYWIACWQYSDISFTTNARLPLEEGSPEREAWFIGGAEGFFKVFPLGIWWYLGIESVPLAAEETFQPRESIPRGANRAVGTTLIVTFVTLITAVSMPPGIIDLSVATFGLSPTLDIVWKIQGAGGEGRSTVLINSALFLSIAGIWGTVHALMFAYGRQIYSLSRAGHQPKMLSYTTSSTRTPYISLVFGTIFGLVIAIIIRLQPEADYHEWVAAMFNIMLLGALFNFTMVLISFIIMRISFAHVPRTYKSPLGIPGAVVAIIMFIMCFISIWIFQKSMWQAAIALLIWFAINLSYYWFHSRHHQVLSPEERFAIYLSVTAQQMLSTGLGYSYLHAHCAKEFSTESIDCWSACSSFMKNPTAQAYLDIYKQYLAKDASTPINIPGQMTRDAVDVAEQLQTPDNSVTALRSARLMLLRIQNEMLQLLNRDTLPRFKSSPQFKHYLNQEPLIYLANNPRPSGTFAKAVIGSGDSVGVGPPGQSSIHHHDYRRDSNASLLAHEPSQNETVDKDDRQVGRTPVRQSRASIELVSVRHEKHLFD